MRYGNIKKNIIPKIPVSGIVHDVQSTATTSSLLSTLATTNNKQTNPRQTTMSRKSGITVSRFRYMGVTRGGVVPRMFEKAMKTVSEEDYKTLFKWSLESRLTDLSCDISTLGGHPLWAVDVFLTTPGEKHERQTIKMTLDQGILMDVLRSTYMPRHPVPDAYESDESDAMFCSEPESDSDSDPDYESKRDTKKRKRPTCRWTHPETGVICGAHGHNKTTCDKGKTYEASKAREVRSCARAAQSYARVAKSHARNAKSYSQDAKSHSQDAKSHSQDAKSIWSGVSVWPRPWNPFFGHRYR
jgi:hypothetical protein